MAQVQGTTVQAFLESVSDSLEDLEVRVEDDKFGIQELPRNLKITKLTCGAIPLRRLVGSKFPHLREIAVLEHAMQHLYSQFHYRVWHLDNFLYWALCQRLPGVSYLISGHTTLIPIMSLRSLLKTAKLRENARFNTTTTTPVGE